ncbi:MAG: hypothetical protein JXA11_07865 [Phycisphaerae bacterium]|nr:hypothetical protein [Phycisphaerae bacterium]
MNMKRIAITVSALTFFAMALVGMVMGQDPFVCAIRALIGAVVSYLAARFAVQLAVDVMIKAVVSGSDGTAEEAVTEETRGTEE